jgi:hypothetical protein
MVQEGPGGQQPQAGEERHPAITAAAILFFLNVLGLPFVLFITAYAVLNGDLPWEWGAPHGRIYDAFGLEMALGAFLLWAGVLMLGVLAGLWLWRGRRSGAVLGAITIAVGPVFWYGFGLPLGPYLGLLQAGLLGAGWKSLR